MVDVVAMNTHFYKCAWRAIAAFRTRSILSSNKNGNTRKGPKVINNYDERKHLKVRD